MAALDFIIVVIALMVSSHVNAYPVVDVPSACAPACGSSFPFYWPTNCTFCLVASDIFNTWNDTYQPRLQRLAAYEAGLTNVPAIAFLQVVENATAALTQIQDTLDATIGTAGATYTIHGITRAAMTEFNTVNSSVVYPNTCIQKQGWLQLLNEVFPPCEGVPPLTLSNVTLSAPEQLAMWFPKGNSATNSSNFAVYQGKAQARVRSYFEDVQAAARSLFEDSTQLAWSTTYLFHNVTKPADLTRLQKMYGPKEWMASWTQLAKAGNLVELDLTYSEGFTPFPAVWNVAAHVLLQYRRDAVTGQISLPAIAVRLSNIAGTGSRNFQVYTVKKSPTAFMLAMSAARSAVATQAIWPGHVLHFHMVQLASGYALRNTINPGVATGMTTHPVRQLLDPITSPMANAPFMFSVMEETTDTPHLPSTAMGDESLIKLMSLYQAKPPLPGKNTFYNMLPEQLLARSGLSVEKFTKHQAWDLYPAAKLQLDVLNVTSTYASKVLHAYYTSDAAVADDEGIQNFAAALTHPLGANLGSLNPSNQLDSREKVVNVTAWVMATTVLHSLAQINDFVLQLYNIGSLPFAVNINHLFDPKKAYTVEQMVAATQNTYSYNRQINFVNVFGVAPPTGPTMVPNKAGTPPFSPSYVADYEGMLPFTVTAEDYPANAANVSNAATTRFRKDLISFLSSTPNCRQTNFSGTPELFAPYYPGWITI